MSKLAPILGFCLVALLVSSASAQTRKRPPRAIKFDEFEQSHSELWVVPQGALLPNPNEDEEQP